MDLEAIDERLRKLHACVDALDVADALEEAETRRLFPAPPRRAGGQGRRPLAPGARPARPTLSQSGLEPEGLEPEATVEEAQQGGRGARLAAGWSLGRLSRTASDWF